MDIIINRPNLLADKSLWLHISGQAYTMRFKIRNKWHVVFQLPHPKHFGVCLRVVVAPAVPPPNGGGDGRPAPRQ